MTHANYLKYGLVIGLISLVAYFMGVSTFRAGATAPNGLMGVVATTSLVSVGPSNAVQITATTTCTARVITTLANPIMLSFSDVLGQTPTATFGHLQAASTTVAYDAGLYGCGRMTAYGFNASTSITFTSVR